MASEIERKFAVADLPSASLLGDGVRLRQGYVAEEGAVEVRVRIEPDRSTLTIKAGTGLTRSEVEVAVSSEQADTLWSLTAGRRLDKTRYRVSLDDAVGLVAEVDVYAGALAGLAVVEVEFDSIEVAESFSTPPWFGRELTGETGWSNAALARHGRPD